MLERTENFSHEPFDPSKNALMPSWFRRGVARLWGLGPLFIATVIAPTALAALYFGFLASDVYISESQFIVRSPDKPATSGFGFLLKSAGFSNAGDEVYAAEDYITSRDALRALNKDRKFEQSYSSPGVFFFDRFGLLGDKTFEDLFKYYEYKIKVDRDSTTYITKLTVRAYNARDAQLFNEHLLEMAEATVNRLNARGRTDLIRFASAEVARAEVKAKEAALALSAYRNREGVIDPERQAAVQLQMISKLQDELIAARNQLLSLKAYTPANPQIAVLETRVNGLQSDIDREMSNVAGGGKSLAARAARYQRLSLESQFADKQLAAAMASLEDARNEAARKQAYVERIVQPNLPDEPLEPRRLRGIAATLLLGLVAWGILSMLIAGLNEHRD